MTARGGGGGGGGGGGPVGGLARQMSLHTPPSQRRPLTRQASEDLKHDPKDPPKDVWGRSSPRSGRHGLQGARTSARPASGGHQPRRSSASPMRPRPVRLAWAASPTPPPAAASPIPGELVARRCPSAQPPPAPPPARPARPAAPSSASVLPSHGGAMSMSRQQLAERLRRAWQDRRPSLDIFLASTEPHEDDDDALSLSSARSALGDEFLARPGPRLAPAASSGRGRGRAPFRSRGSMADHGPPSLAVGSLARCAAGGAARVGGSPQVGPIAFSLTNEDALSVCSVSSDLQQPRLLQPPASPLPAPSPAPSTPRPGPPGPAPPDPSSPSHMPPPASPPSLRAVGAAAPGAEAEAARESDTPGPAESGQPSQRGQRACSIVLMLAESEDSGSLPARPPPQPPPPPPPPQPPSEPRPGPGPAPGTPTSAAARRLQFRNSGKTFISGSTAASPARPRTAGTSRPPGTPAPAPLQRALSTSSATSSTCPPKGILVSRSRLQSATSVDVLDADPTPRALAGALAAALAGGAAGLGPPAGAAPGPGPGAGGRVKSAPPARNAARKLKTAAARRGRLRSGGHSDSSDESRDREKDKDKDKDDKKGSRNVRRGVARAPGRAPSEVVTMVSLLSASDSAPESDAEADTQADADRYTGSAGFASLRAPSATAAAGPGAGHGATPGPAPTSSQPQAASAQAPQLPKAPKSVWFQPSGMPLRRLGPELSQPPCLGLGQGAGLGVSFKVAHGLASEKRAPSVEASTAKRRLTRALSEPVGPAGLDCGADGVASGSVPSGLQIPLSLLLRVTEPAPAHAGGGPGHSAPPADDQRPSATGGPRPGPRSAASPGSQDEHRGEDDGEGSDVEPTFSTPKERECWELFKKMSDKGIAVSYDTVLRGMLTPTEYRMRRNSVLSSC